MDTSNKIIFLSLARILRTSKNIALGIVDFVTTVSRKEKIFLLHVLLFSRFFVVIDISFLESFFIFRVQRMTPCHPQLQYPAPHLHRTWG